MSSLSRDDKHRSAGFSLVELMVAASIILIMTSVVLFNHQDLSDSVELTSAAQELALTIREAQVKGLAVERISDDEDGFDAGRGVYLDLNNDHYIYFADLDGDGEFDGDDEDNEAIDRQDLGADGFEIVALDCGEGEACGEGELHITYHRPRPQARFFDGDGEVEEKDSQRVAITLESARSGRQRTVEVFRTGQISIMEVGD